MQVNSAWMVILSASFIVPKADYEHEYEHEHEKPRRAPFHCQAECYGIRASFVLVLVLVLVIGF